MKQSQKGTSIIEAMVVLLVVTSGIVGVYQILIESQKLSDSTENRIIALQIAREGIEAMTNIRNTNWFLFAADTKNCWNTLNYNPNCISNGTTTYDLIENTSFSLFQGLDNKWYLKNPVVNETRSYTGATYRTDYRVGKDTNGFYTQSGGLDFVPNFTREVKVTYINTNSVPLVDSNDEKMQIRSIVSWSDRSSATPKRVELTTVLSNWK